MTRLRLALLLLAAAGSAQAADIRPGLWEFRSTRVSLGGAPDLSDKLRQQLANLPPEVQRQLRQQLAAQGVQLGSDGAVRSCITPEQARQDSVYAGRSDGNCTLASITKSGNQVRGRLNCSQPKGSADFETTLDGPERMSTRVNMHSAQGDIQMDTDARWIAACGTATRQE
ncbi:hypothetical protein GCM10007933_42490 [Zoogloea oryzae]|uniref:DUF3617 domain-containing protein n=1 Tax=Zoogloea oryzae TaxID=310767 RepID=A0ABQ6FGI6_9RHOO|nr:DUF3617 domain-containing protein [Zoogloea oryzae]GLT24753.1 hypothetical protein GCM10007933_42490 [Zoogloea oryzae]